MYVSTNVQHSIDSNDCSAHGLYPAALQSLLFSGSDKRPYLRVTSIHITPGSPLRAIPSMMGVRSEPTDTSTELFDIQPQPGASGS